MRFFFTSELSDLIDPMPGSASVPINKKIIRKLLIDVELL